MPELKREKIRREFDEKLKNLDEEDPFYMSVLESLERKKEEDLDAVNSFEKRNKTKKQKT